MSGNGLTQAEARVREMNRMTRQYSEQGNRYMRQNQWNTQVPQTPQTPQTSGQRQTRFEPVRQAPPPPERTPKPEPERPRQPRDFQPDSEKLMILLIMYVLIKEKADMKLILALGYLLL